MSSLSHKCTTLWFKLLTISQTHTSVKRL